MTMELRLGGLALDEADLHLEALGTDSGTDWGNPQPIEVQLSSFLQYGSLVASEGWETRIAKIAVSVSGTDLAAREAELAAEVGKPNELFYKSPTTGVTTCYQVLTSSFDQVPDDLLEISLHERVYMLRLVCLPFALSEDETITPALAPTGTTTTLVDNMSSTSGWTAYDGAGSLTPVAASGTLTASTGPVTGLSGVRLARAGTIDTSSTKYLVVDWKAGAGPRVGGIQMQAGPIGTPTILGKIAESASPTPGYTRTTFYAPMSSITLLTIMLLTDGRYQGDSIARSLTLDNLDRSDIRPGNAKTQTRALVVGGSAPTTGSLSIEHPTAALGDVVVYTCPDDGSGYAPPCRPYWVGGSVSSDSTAVSGFADSVAPSSTVQFQIPARLLPEGEYLLMIRAVALTADTTMYWTGTQILGNQALAGTPLVSYFTVKTGGYQLYRIGTGHFPLLDVPDVDSSKLWIILQNPSGSAGTVRIDDLWVFNLTTGDVSQLSCGTGTPSLPLACNRAWIDSPGLDNNGLGAYLKGTVADRSDAYSAAYGAPALGIHEFPPGPLKVFTITTGPTTPPDVALRHRKSWLHTAAD